MLLCLLKRIRQINRLFTNLLQNAIEAIPEEETGYVTVREERRLHSVRISISDNGLGIPKAMLVNIFTPNFTTKTSGTGLGLAICKGIVEQSRGSIWFDTEEGKGTTFYMNCRFMKMGLRYEGVRWVGCKFVVWEFIVCSLRIPKP